MARAVKWNGSPEQATIPRTAYRTARLSRADAFKALDQLAR